VSWCVLGAEDQEDLQKQMNYLEGEGFEVTQVIGHHDEDGGAFFTVIGRIGYVGGMPIEHTP